MLALVCPYCLSLCHSLNTLTILTVALTAWLMWDISLNWKLPVSHHCAYPKHAHCCHGVLQLKLSCSPHMEVTLSIRGIMFSTDSNEAAIVLPCCRQIDWLTEKSVSVRDVKGRSEWELWNFACQRAPALSVVPFQANFGSIGALS